MTLEQFINQGIKAGAQKGYHPTVFLGMRQEYGTVEAIERLVKTSEPRSGFARMKALGLLEWSLEAAVLKFPDQFSQAAKDNAEARFERTLKPA